MPRNGIPLDPAEFAESTVVSIKLATEACCSYATAYKIPQNCGIILHSLGVFLAVERDCNSVEFNPRERDS